MKNEPAFPYSGVEVVDCDTEGGLMPATANVPFSYSGLTKRELFAAMAMQGILASDWASKGRYSSVGVIDARTVQEIAVQHADALIAELEK